MLGNGYYWVKFQPTQCWEVVKYLEGFFYSDDGGTYEADDLFILDNNRIRTPDEVRVGILIDNEADDLADNIRDLIKQAMKKHKQA